ncbi:hypothetical protein M378DRAFT_468858 [Amanita muscaria Koide BX008]|uniref:Uncharacterized protein n=1 Tax=Amanita muscaria (strain Koide BX008) TaxID=946122 RepID=A0A0C2W5Q7_AMAMK|nr:hypothetical protein M378DRAFT_468858 [Amanita muscaria Koide BX008]
MPQHTAITQYGRPTTILRLNWRIQTDTNAYNRHCARHPIISCQCVVANSHNLTSTYNSGHHSLVSLMNNALSSWKSPSTIQQTQSHAHNGQANHPGNLAFSTIQQSPTMAVEVPTSADYYRVTLVGGINSTNVMGDKNILCTGTIPC